MMRASLTRGKSGVETVYDAPATMSPVGTSSRRVRTPSFTTSNMTIDLTREPLSAADDRKLKEGEAAIGVSE